MCDGMTNIIEHKVVRTLSQMTKTYAFGGLLRQKIQDYLSNESARFLTEKQLMGWRQVNYDDPIQIERQPDYFRPVNSIKKTPKKVKKLMQESDELSLSQTRHQR